CYDPVAKKTMVTHPDLKWQLLLYDRAENSYRLSAAKLPGNPSKQVLGGLVYDSLNREMVMIGGVSKETGAFPTCRFDRDKDKWIDLEAKNLGRMGVGQDTCVFDPEHNVIIELITGTAYRLRQIPAGTKAFYGGGIGVK